MDESSFRRRKYTDASQTILILHEQLFAPINVRSSGDPLDAMSDPVLDRASEMNRYARQTTSCEIEAASASFFTEHLQFAAR